MTGTAPTQLTILTNATNAAGLALDAHRRTEVYLGAGSRSRSAARVAWNAKTAELVAVRAAAEVAAIAELANRPDLACTCAECAE